MTANPCRIHEIISHARKSTPAVTMAARSFVIAFVACVAVLGASGRAHAAPVAFTAGKAPGSTADMTVQVDPKTAAFTVAIDGVNWLSGGEVAVQAAGTWHTSSGTAPTLKLDGGIGQTFSGGDSTGLYSATQFTWLLPPGTAHPTSAATQARMVTTVRVYTDVSAVAFEQRFPDGLADTSVGNTDAVLSSFPTFGEVLPEGDDLGYTSYWGAFIGNSHSGRWWNSTRGAPAGRLRGVGADASLPCPCAGTSDPFFGGKAGGPFVVYDNSMQNSLVVSPFSQFMAASFYEDTSQPQKVIRAGIMGGVMSLPPGYSLDTIVYHGAGFNQAVHEWGATLLQRYGKNANGRTLHRVPCCRQRAQSLVRTSVQLRLITRLATSATTRTTGRITIVRAFCIAGHGYGGRDGCGTHRQHRARQELSGDADRCVPLFPVRWHPVQVHFVGLLVCDSAVAALCGLAHA